MGFLDELPIRAGRTGARIVLAEGVDPRMLEAAARLRAETGLEPTVLVPPDVPAPAGLPGSAVRCPADDPQLEPYAELYRDLRPSEHLSLEAARERARDPLIFAGLMLRAVDADGAVAGAHSATEQVIRAALRCVGTAEGVRTVSGAFYMVVPAFRAGEGSPGEPEVLTFTDAGAVPDPDVDQLVEIAERAAAVRRRIVGDEPRIAFLSYSTHGSAGGPSVEKMRDAAAVFRARYPDTPADGELQVDAALIEAVGARKAPDSPVAGRANVLVFPDLDAGNIAYKLVERLAGAAAIGPILHGLARPYNDLSRGTGVDGVVWVACMTALMAERS